MTIIKDVQPELGMSYLQAGRGSESNALRPSHVPVGAPPAGWILLFAPVLVGRAGHAHAQWPHLSKRKTLGLQLQDDYLQSFLNKTAE